MALDIDEFTFQDCSTGGWNENVLYGKIFKRTYVYNVFVCLTILLLRKIK
ncbi:hypothetical protein KDA_57380 [Dictyobacter alpinus]|uniref:Uncharacterized protein n=1 Tax=Dictyobacter alpinus TaxID=2014873 RepID=A0A402BFV7_9CHLR|nr:hypothetical protein KDA_57380 [Dictyobacter alpinus]